MKYLHYGKHANAEHLWKQPANGAKTDGTVSGHLQRTLKAWLPAQCSI